METSMADETSKDGTAAGSSASSPVAATAGNAPLEEVRIIEEIVVKPATHAALSPTPVTASAAATEKPAAPPPAPEKAPEAVASRPVAPVEIPVIPSQTSAEKTAETPPLNRTPEEFAKEQDAIAKILKEIKLPERRLPSDAPPSAQTVFDTALAGEVDHATGEKKQGSATLPSPTPAPFPRPPEKNGTGLAATIVSPLRTLKNDLQTIIRVKKISLVRAAALESEKHRGGTDPERSEVQKNQVRRRSAILFAVAIFLVLGAAAFFGVFLIMGERAGIPAETSQSAILFAENGVPFPLTSASSIELKRILAQARLGGGGTLGSITRIIPTVSETTAEGTPTGRPATLEEFLRAIGARAPEELYRALPQDFFFGIHTVDENAPLFVIPVASYERAFASMLRWEETLNADLSPVFTPVPDQVIGSGGLPEKRRFEDVVMRNYDVRVLKDDAGTIELYYSFPTRELLVIAESPYSFTEILSRLRAERKL